VLYNGGSGSAVSYASVALDVAGAELPAGGYLVVGSSAVLAMLPPDVASVVLPGSIQNGDPDGLAIERDGVIVDSLTYGGSLSGITETASALSDSGAGSIGRCAGFDSDDNSADFAFFDAPSPGSQNPC
jgi:hypothetical protein